MSVVQGNTPHSNITPQIFQAGVEESIVQLYTPEDNSHETFPPLHLAILTPRARLATTASTSTRAMAVHRTVGF